MDTGNDSSIENADQNAGQEAEWQWESEVESTVLDPSRWWFANTACPLIASTFGPMASGFNICALAVYWRMRVPAGTLQDVGTPIEDPHWLPGVNALSLFCALVGNAFLLLNMVSRVRFITAQPITVIGFFMASVILIALLAVAQTSALKIEPWSEYAFSQAYYYACFAAGIYMIISLLMLFTIYGAIANKYERKFHLTPAQRTLMLQTMSFMGYLLIGAAVFSALENWNYLDAVYWSDFTLLTIGIGRQFTPKTHAGRSLLIPYTFGGIIAVGLIISSIRSMLIERGSEKLHARTTERRRQTVHDLTDAERGGGWMTKFKSGTKPNFDNLPEQERRRREFEAMRGIKTRAHHKNRYASLAISTLAAAILWFVGALVFWYSEHAQQDWSYFVSMYFSYTSLITLGYGDFGPNSNAGKAFFVFWTLLAVPTLTVLISDMSSTVVKGISEATNWIGAVTITPGDPAYWNQLKGKLNEISRGHLFTVEEESKETKKEESPSEERRPHNHDDVARILDSRLTKEEKQDMDNFGQESNLSIADRDRIFHRYMLTKEIQTLLADSNDSPPKEYTYEEWKYFLLLLSHDESTASYHTTAYNAPKKDDEDGPQVARIRDHGGNPRAWSWLGLRSPLLCQESEAEWILRRLMKALQSEMQFPTRPVQQAQPRRPPFSVSLMRQHATQSDVDLERSHSEEDPKKR